MSVLEKSISDALSNARDDEARYRMAALPIPEGLAQTIVELTKALNELQSKGKP